MDAPTPEARPSQAASTTAPRRRLRRFATFNLFVAFAFTVMADPVSSVTYALEAALRSLGGDLSSLVLTMGLVLGTIAVVAVTYDQLIRRFPGGAGGAEALAEAFGEGWAFVPAGALLVDFTLTAAVSCAAAASAAIAYVPELADSRATLAVLLAAAVAGGSLFGHRGRVAFATATLAFVAVGVLVAVRGATAVPTSGVDEAGPLVSWDGLNLAAAALAMPLGMALATGVEAPSNAIAQLGQLDDAGRRRFGRLTVWTMLAIVSVLTAAFAVLAVRLGIGLPPVDSTLLAEIARRATGGDFTFLLFQLGSALLLLAAGASAFLAGSGLLKALAMHGETRGLVPRRLGRVNRWYAPPWGIAVLLVTTALLVLAAGGRDQEIVHFYAVAVFASFLSALVACARLSARDGHRVALTVNVVGIALVGFVLILNLARVAPIVSLAASGLVSVSLWRSWVAQGRPGGVVSRLR